MTARSLIGHDALDRARRRAARTPLLRLTTHPLLWPPLLGGALAGGLVAIGRPDALLWWLGVTLASAALIVMSGPWRLFWRRDANLLGRLPIPGLALYRLAGWSALRSALQLGVVLILAALPNLTDHAIFVHQALLAAALLFAAALAAPAATALAGALIISAKTQDLLRQVTGGQTLPGIIYLSLIPAFSGMGIAYAGLLGTRVILGVTVAVCVVAHVLLERVTSPVLADATREIAALDAVKLAHVDLTTARGVEKMIGTISCAPPARSIFVKDVALLRRRHPGFYILTGMAIIAAWIQTFAAPNLQVTLAITGALCAYVVLFGRRLASPPSELPRLLASLPIASSAVAHAKRVHVGYRTFWAVLLAAGPAVVKAGAVTPAVLAGAMILVTWLGAALASRVPRPLE